MKKRYSMLILLSTTLISVQAFSGSSDAAHIQWQSALARPHKTLERTLGPKDIMDVVRQACPDGEKQIFQFRPDEQFALECTYYADLKFVCGAEGEVYWVRIPCSTVGTVSCKNPQNQNRVTDFDSATAALNSTVSAAASTISSVFSNLFRAMSATNDVSQAKKDN